MEDIILTYLKPELVVLIPVLYFIGLGLKKANFVADKFIPLILGAISIVMVFIYILAIEGWSMNVVWFSFIQGVLASAGSVYFNQIYKQLTKK